MKLCLSKSPGRRPTAQRLMSEMVPEAKRKLGKLGGSRAKTDLEVKYEDED